MVGKERERDCQQVYDITLYFKFERIVMEDLKHKLEYIIDNTGIWNSYIALTAQVTS